MKFNLYEFSYLLENQRFSTILQVTTIQFVHNFSLSAEYFELCSLHTFIVLFGQYSSVHISGFGLTSQRAAQCNGILITVISILYFQ